MDVSPKKKPNKIEKGGMKGKRWTLNLRGDLRWWSPRKCEELYDKFEKNRKESNTMCRSSRWTYKDLHMLVDYHLQEWLTDIYKNTTIYPFMPTIFAFLYHELQMSWFFTPTKTEWVHISSFFPIFPSYLCYCNLLTQSNSIHPHLSARSKSSLSTSSKIPTFSLSTLATNTTPNLQYKLIIQRNLVDKKRDAVAAKRTTNERAPNRTPTKHKSNNGNRSKHTYSYETLTHTHQETTFSLLA